MAGCLVDGRCGWQVHLGNLNDDGAVVETIRLFLWMVGGLGVVGRAGYCERYLECA